MAPFAFLRRSHRREMRRGPCGRMRGPADRRVRKRRGRFPWPECAPRRVPALDDLVRGACKDLPAGPVRVTAKRYRSSVAPAARSARQLTGLDLQATVGPLDDGLQAVAAAAAIALRTACGPPTHRARIAGRTGIGRNGAAHATAIGSRVAGAAARLGRATRGTTGPAARRGVRPYEAAPAARDHGETERVRGEDPREHGDSVPRGGVTSLCRPR